MAAWVKWFDGNASGSSGAKWSLQVGQWLDVRSSRAIMLQARTRAHDAGGALGIKIEFKTAIAPDPDYRRDITSTGGADAVSLDATVGNLSKAVVLVKDATMDSSDYNGVLGWLAFDVLQDGTSSGAWGAEFELWALLQDEV